MSSLFVVVGLAAPASAQTAETGAGDAPSAAVAAGDAAPVGEAIGRARWAQEHPIAAAGLEGTTRYLVRFADGTDVAAATDGLAAAGVVVEDTYEAIFPGAVVSLTDDLAATLAADPAVVEFEPDPVLTLSLPGAPAESPDPAPTGPGTPAEPTAPGPAGSTGDLGLSARQNSPTWGLDRIDQRSRPLNSTYWYPGSGAGVTAYIVDSGIKQNHVDFGGRALPGAYAINDGWYSYDCNGHGTHVAGTVGSATYGVAKGVTLVPVRVVGCGSSVYTSDLVSGLNWVVSNHAYGTPAVANISIGGPTNSWMDSAVQAVIDDGVTVVVSAGNDGANSCYASPAHIPAAITVAATDSSDWSPYWSNYGPCVDLFAPGVSVWSTWNTSTTAVNSLDGTSMASPHVAGAVAVLLGLEGNLSPSTVASRIRDNATTGKVGFPGAGTPNRLLYSPPGSTTVPSNDSFSKAAKLSLPGTSTKKAYNENASKEPGEPYHAGNAGGRSLWWKFTPPRNGVLRISTEGSSFDTVMAVYTGTWVGGLSTIASDDDGGEGTTSLITMNVVAGTEYRLAVDGWNNRSGTIKLNVGPLVSPPSAPGKPTLTARVGGLDVAWPAPSSTNGAPVDDYGIWLRVVGAPSFVLVADAVSSARTSVLGGLTPGTWYEVMVDAHNPAGWGTTSKVSKPLQVPAVPSVPLDLVGTPTSTGVELKWDKPASTNGAPITDYWVEYRPSGGSWTRLPGPSTSRTRTVGPLTLGPTHEFRVAAVNLAGAGAYTPVVVLVAGSPKAPSKPSVSAGAGSLKVTWSAPSSNGSPIVDYLVQYQIVGALGWTTFADGVSTVRVAVIPGLVPGTPYVVRVAAVNGVGTGPWSVPSSSKIVK